MAIETLVLGIPSFLFPFLMVQAHASILPLLGLFAGAGQEVGKSCVLVTINGKRIMFDCGMHMGFLDHRRYPDFTLVDPNQDFNSAITCIIITHLFESLHSQFFPFLIIVNLDYSLGWCSFLRFKIQSLCEKIVSFMSATRKFL